MVRAEGGRTAREPATEERTGWYALWDSDSDSGRRTLGRESCDRIYVSTGSLCSRIIAPKAVQGPCLQDPWPCCTTQQKGIKMADGSKAGNQVTLRWGDYPLQKKADSPADTLTLDQ